MSGWVKYVTNAGQPGFLNLDAVASAFVRQSSDGVIVFLFQDGSNVTADLGVTDADAEVALRRLVGAVDPADYV